MDFEWDETKREKVLLERSIDFLLLAIDLFDGRPLMTKPSPRMDEERFISVGQVGMNIFALVWTRREGQVRIITARRARDGEARQYRTLHD